MNGDPTLFARQDAVEAAWKIVQGILGNVTPIHEYEPGSWGPEAATRLTAGVGGWSSVEGRSDGTPAERA
jgi:glucose-6-phosphate 1-dehydrogenase